MDSYQLVLEYFEKATEQARTGDKVEATGLDKKEVEKAMNKMKKEGKIVSPKRCYWEIEK